MRSATSAQRPTEARTPPRPSAPPLPHARSAPPASTFTRSGVRESRAAVRQVLLGCGVLSSVLYVLVVSLPYEGYSPVTQNVSELLAVGGVLTAQDVPLLAANLPTPWMGLKERINIYPYMLWVAALALSLWPGRGAGSPREGNPTAIP